MEIWKNIIGYDNYEVSNMGKVRSIKFINQHIEKQQQRIHKERLTCDGYVKVSLRKNGLAYEFRMHRLVATHFIDNPLNLETVNHKNGNKRNNKVDNLEWMNRHDQLQHAYDMGLKKPMQGIENPNSKITENDVRYIRTHCVKGSREFGTSALARKFGVDNTIIGKIVNGVSYKNVK